jgi:Ca2+-binding RTX toxin-like protein
MAAKQLKNKLNKKTPLLMSPFGFALAACGGGGEDGSPVVAPKLSTVLTFTPSGDETIDMMTTSSYYRSSATSPISYGLTDGHYGEQWEDPEAVAAVLQDVMAEFNQYADINLQYAGKYDSPNAATSAGVSVILSFDKFIFEVEGSDDVWHHFYPHATDDGGAGIDQIGGDLYLNFNASGWTASSQAVFESRITDTDFGFAALMHGMLGTVGVKSTYAEADGHPSIENTKWADDADAYMISASNISYDSIVGDFGATLGILDILALMHLYGPNPTTNIGDTEYNLSDINEYFVVYDAGGEDTVSFEETDRDVDIGMPTLKITERFINVEDLKIGAFIISAGTTQEVSGFGIGDLENIKTGSGDDVIYTNTLDNTVHAGAGDDTIILSAGSDVIYGGSGADTFVTEAIAFDGYQVGTNTIIKDFEIGIDTLDLPFAPDEGVYSRNEDGFATYTNSAGVNVVLEGIEANVLLIA